MICRMNLIHCEFANSNGYCERTACCNPNIVGNTIKNEEQKAYSQQYVDELKAKYGWHTGTPRKEKLEHEHCYAISHNVGHGFYLVGTLFKANHENGCFESEEVYDNIGNVDTLKFEFNDKSIRWQKIEPFEASK